MKAICTLFLTVCAAPLWAQEAGVPAGCEPQVTLLWPNCEMHQVMHCEGDVVRVDVYADGVFLGEEAREGLTTNVWRRGNLLQRVVALSGDLSDVPALTAGDSAAIEVERSRQILGSDTDPMVEAFTLNYERLGSAEREMPSGQVIAVTQYHEVSMGAGAEAVDMVVDFMPTWRLPIWRQGELTAPDGTVSAYSMGYAAFYGAEHPAFLTISAPEDAPCTPEG